jgi:hypothetical protein
LATAARTQSKSPAGASSSGLEGIAISEVGGFINPWHQKEIGGEVQSLDFISARRIMDSGADHDSDPIIACFPVLRVSRPDDLLALEADFPASILAGPHQAVDDGQDDWPFRFAFAQINGRRRIFSRAGRVGEEPVLS